MSNPNPENQYLKQYHLGLECDQNGQYTQALDIFSKLADDPKVSNDMRLSSLFNVGCQLNKLGSKRSSFQVYADCAKQGHATAQYYIAVQLENINHIFATAYYVAAAKNGSKAALAALEDLGIENILQNKNYKVSMGEIDDQLLDQFCKS